STPLDLHSFPTRRSSDLTKCDPIGAALNEIAFSTQPRHPEAVDDVCRRHLELNGRPDGEVQLVVRADVQRGIAILPPPLVSDDRSEEHTSELQSRFDLVC